MIYQGTQKFTRAWARMGPGVATPLLQSPLLTEIRRGLVLRGVARCSIHACMYIHCVEVGSYENHLSIYCNDNHSLSNLYSPYVVPATPKVSVAPSTTSAITGSSVVLIIIYKPIASRRTPLHSACEAKRNDISNSHNFFCNQAQE